jgi:hypothetical protein
MDEVIANIQDLCTGMSKEEILEELQACEAAAKIENLEGLADYIFELCGAPGE